MWERPTGSWSRSAGSRAAELLRAGATAEAAARAVGYENMSFFYRKFRAAYGCTPATYRGRVQ